MGKGRNVKPSDVEDISQLRQFMPSQRFPASCPWCGTNSRIHIATTGPLAGNQLDCDNCSRIYTWQ